MKKFTVETSARHVHIAPADLAVLFGEGATLTPKKYLSQPIGYASEERVDIIGPKGTFKNVSILGPTRDDTQVEISLTDARALGIVAPIRESGDLKQSASCTLVGPKGSLTLKQGVIVAKRHIHASVKDAQKLDVKDKDVVYVAVEGEGRRLIFGDVVVRVSDDFALTMHIDTDEANAGGLKGEVWGEIVKL